MFHNTLYRLERGQKKVLFGLGVTFLLLSALWLLVELLDMKYPMEPIVVFVGGIATLLASYWPWKPGYKDKRLKGRVVFDYENTNDHRFVIGKGEMAFTLKFSKAGASSIHMYRDPDDIKRIARIHGAGRFDEVRDITALEYENRAVTPEEGDLVALENSHGSYAIVHIHDIRDATRGDGRDEVTFSFVINPIGKTDFS
ncbi:hypothetical protein [Pseudomonas monteilii]|uniref:hypothetical protein n=1 Tax=Pseudomonas monteilii TaxID=76759 RepID=UPI0039069A88